MLTNPTRATLVQLLRSIKTEAVHLLVLKHLDVDLASVSATEILDRLAHAKDDNLVGLLIELIEGKTAIRADAFTKSVFDARLEELQRRLRADGFEVTQGTLSRILPAAEPVATIADHLEQALADSPLDADGEIRRLLRESHNGMSAVSPDYNGSTTKARIALETIARRSATAIAHSRSRTPPADTWGPALSFLKTESVITQAEEDAFAKAYTLISPGAHLPKGLTAEQWALLARAWALSAAYFLIRQYLAA